ncbi:hypothetical protein [Paraliomyxa miuraensis]|uniref:hypothetical protein n=1 Tax=Paraliomyxa miuraensis TaxID=376150 RepID=UPI002257041F|nr:hypothetical protein [Paraliomyxa miuraensis]MCX4239678.1 hypothetical protein [Paraliomyxa miuraensis]
MQPRLRPTWGWTLALALPLTGCPDDPPAGDGTSTTGIDTLPPTTGEPTGDTGETTEAGTADGTSGGPELPCETVLCGEAAACCGADEECAAGTCQPACDSGVRCGAAQDVCCEAGQVCLSETCVTPTGPCQDSFDCDFGEFCEPTLNECLPQSEPVVCELEPEFEQIDATEEWAFTADQVVSSPVVADLDGDGSPEVIVNTTHMDGGSWPEGEVVVLSGVTGAELWRVDHNPGAGSYGSHGRHSLGVGDVSGDGRPDIVYAGRQAAGGSIVHAVDGTNGTLLWSSHDPDGTPRRLDIVNGAASLANLDADPEAEIVFGAAVIDDDGTVVWNQGGDGANYGTNGSYRGGISALVDLTGDGTPEIVSGRHAWSVDWQDVGGVPNVTVSLLWDAGGNDGYPAIADLDQDGTPEVVVVASGYVRVLDGETGLGWCGVDPTDAMCQADPTLRTASVAIPGGGLGGPPTISDFDGDGRPEIAAAGGSSYSVYDLARAGEDIVVPAGNPMPTSGSIYVRWSQPTQDQSSNATGSSVFDFQGDGVAEVVYADECYMRVYSGVDGTVLLELPNSTGTIHEYPLVVDVDDDGNSEILVVANDGHSACNGIPGYTYTRGVRSFGDTFDQWVQTRRVWTQHTYHVTNSTAQGIVPAVETNNWLQPGLNNYRQNVQGEGVFNAPDLTAELAVGLANCLDQELVLLATVRNVGSLGVPAGVEVTLYEGTDATGSVVGTQATPAPLLPGAQVVMQWTVPFPPGTEALSYYVEVDGSGGDGAVLECDESNNGASTVSAECPMPG